MALARPACCDCDQAPLYRSVCSSRTALLPRLVPQGIEEAVLLMPVGAIWKLEIPGALAFGEAGRGASPGKARIPPNAAVQYVLELAGLPGKEEDLFYVIGDKD
jgi:hypothetical protein